MRDVLSSIMRSQRTAPVPTVPPAPTRKRRLWKPALLLLGGAVLGAAPFLLQLWGGQQSRKLSFEHAFAIAQDTSSPGYIRQTAWVRIMRLVKEGFGSLHELKAQRTAFEPTVTSALDRFRSLLKGQKIARRGRPNGLSYAEALAGISSSSSSQALVQTCLDLIAYDIEEAIRGLQVVRQKGGEPGQSATMILSWFRRFLEGE